MKEKRIKRGVSCTANVRQIYVSATYDLECIVTKIMAGVKCAILMLRNHVILMLNRAKYLTFHIKVLHTNSYVPVSVSTVGRSQSQPSCCSCSQTAGLRGRLGRTTRRWSVYLKQREKHRVKDGALINMDLLTRSMVLASRASGCLFGHSNPSKASLRTLTFLGEGFLKMSISSIKLNFIISI